MTRMSIYLVEREIRSGWEQPVGLLRVNAAGVTPPLGSPPWLSAGCLEVSREIRKGLVAGKVIVPGPRRCFPPAASDPRGSSALHKLAEDGATTADSSRVPRRPVPGGFFDQPLYAGRAHHQSPTWLVATREIPPRRGRHFNPRRQP